jgi:hypothetical protein
MTQTSSRGTNFDKEFPIETDPQEHSWDIVILWRSPVPTLKLRPKWSCLEDLLLPPTWNGPVYIELCAHLHIEIMLFGYIAPLLISGLTQGEKEI